MKSEECCSMASAIPLKGAESPQKSSEDIFQAAQSLFSFDLQISDNHSAL